MLELISFPLCPYVQRSVITLRHKKVDFKLTHIDLENKPGWFDQISPLGQVPVLRVDDVVLFESAVINEYLDETTLPRMHPEDPLRRAHNRAWIAFGGELLGDMFAYLAAKADDRMLRAEQDLVESLSRLESQVTPDPFFNGDAMSLVDCAYAPLFMRLDFARRIRPLPGWEDMKRLQHWSNALLAEPAVRESAPAEFEEMMKDWLKRRGSAFVASQ